MRLGGEVHANDSTKHVMHLVRYTALAAAARQLTHSDAYFPYFNTKNRSGKKVLA